MKLKLKSLNLDLLLFKIGHEPIPESLRKIGVMKNIFCFFIIESNSYSKAVRRLKP